MKKVITILCLAFVVASITPSCSSTDETLEEMVVRSEIDASYSIGDDEDGSNEAP